MIRDSWVLVEAFMVMRFAVTSEIEAYTQADGTRGSIVERIVHLERVEIAEGLRIHLAIDDLLGLCGRQIAIVVRRSREPVRTGDVLGVEHVRIGLMMHDDMFEVFLWGRNLTNTDGLVDDFRDFFGTLVNHPNIGRTYGVGIVANF